MMVAAKSEDLEYSTLYLGNFSKGDAEQRIGGVCLRPGTDTRQNKKTRSVAGFHIKILIGN
jgi:hypothetical protein